MTPMLSPPRRQFPDSAADAAAAAIFRRPAGLGFRSVEGALIFFPEERALHAEVDDLPGKASSRSRSRITQKSGLSGAVRMAWGQLRSSRATFSRNSADSAIAARKQGLHVGPLGHIKVNAYVGNLLQRPLNPLWPALSVPGRRQSSPTETG